MARQQAHTGSNIERSEYYGALQSVVEALFESGSSFVNPGEYPPKVRRLDVILQAESADLPPDLQEIVELLPPGNYTRKRLCDQINSAITGHAWGQVYGTVE